MKGVRKAATSLKKATVDIVDKVASNGLADLDFLMSADSITRSLSDPSEADLSMESSPLTFHDPLLDKFRNC